MGRWYPVAFPLLTVLLLLPVWLVPVAPLIDLPTHMARAHAHHFFHTDPFFATYLRISPHLQHNSAVELVLSPLLSVLSLERATQCFLSLTLLLFAAGCHWTGRAIRGAGHGFGPSHPPMLACLFLGYHGMFLYGYVNFSIGLALALLTLGLRIGWASQWNLWRVLTLSVLCTITYLFHLGAVAILGFAWAVWTLHEGLSRRRLTPWDVLSFVAFVPAAALYLLYGRVTAAGAAAWASPEKKALLLLTGFTAHSLTVTVLTSAICIAAIAVGLWLYRHSLSRPALVAGFAFGLLFLVTPNAFHGAFDVDVRFVPIAFLLLAAAINGTGTARPAPWLLALVLAALLLRHAEMILSWQQAAPDLARAQASLSVIERHSPVYNFVWLDPDPAVNKRTRHFLHIAALSVARNHSRYEPLSRIPRGTWPFEARPDFPHGAELHPLGHIDTLNWPLLRAERAFLWTYGLTPEALEELRPRTQILHESGPVRVLRVQP